MKQKIYCLIALAMLSVTSCEDSIQVKTRSQLTEELVLKDVTSMQSFFNGTLSTLRNVNYYGNNYVLFSELMADNCKLVNAGDRSGRGLNQSINLSGSHMNIWFLYQTINRINVLLSAIERGDIVITTQADFISVTRVKAQALFLRALYHFDLVRLYAYNPNYILKNWDKGVPYVRDAVRAKDDITYPSRPTILSNYEDIETDLMASIAAFDETGAPFSSGSASVNARNVPTKAAAQALLARVYLYWAGPLYPDKYALASLYATEVINSAFATNAANSAALTTQWTATQIHSESIFEVMFFNQAENLGGDNSLEGWYTRNVTATGARLTGWGDVIASDELVAAHNPTDSRLTGLMQQARRDFEPIASRETRKYKAFGTAQFGQDNVPVIRLPEMHLIRAEANLLGPVVNEAAALADIQVVRARAGLTTPLDPLVFTGSVLRDEYFAERRRELAFEGHRYFDFTRRGLDIGKPAGSVIENDDYRVLANIPLAEVQANKNLEQNPGY